MICDNCKYVLSADEVLWCSPGDKRAYEDRLSGRDGVYQCPRCFHLTPVRHAIGRPVDSTHDIAIEYFTVEGQPHSPIRVTKQTDERGVEWFVAAFDNGGVGMATVDRVRESVERWRARRKSKPQNHINPAVLSCGTEWPGYNT